MSKNIENLHTTIRRYCINRHTYWWEEYMNLNATGKGFSADNGYSDEALATFPRYNVMSAILTEVERYRPSDFLNYKEAKELLTLAVKVAESVFTKPPNEKIAEQVMSEERELLYKYIEELTEEDLEKVEPLFYRYVLSKKESGSIWQKLKEKWFGFDYTQSYWYPLTDWEKEGIEAFQYPYFEKEFGDELLRKLLKELGTEKVWEFREGNINYEIELDNLEPYYSGEEGFWFDNTFEWVIYASHESSITFAGSILPKIKNNWENWEQNLWKHIEF